MRHEREACKISDPNEMLEPMAQRDGTFEFGLQGRSKGARVLAFFSKFDVFCVCVFSQIW